MDGEMEDQANSVKSKDSPGSGENGAVRGAECACHASGASPGRAKKVVGQIVLLVALALVIRALVQGRDEPGPNQTAAFSAPAGRADGAAETVDQRAHAVPAGRGSEMLAPVAATETEGGDVASAAGETPAGETTAGGELDAFVCGESIGSLSDLNEKASENEGVFVFLAGKDIEKARQAIAVIEKAAGKIRGRGAKLGLFTLQRGSAEFRSLALEMPPPAVLAMVKGRGASPVIGDMTEEKLLQAYVAASGTNDCGVGGCESGGDGASGCP